jgi:hypothetical protein
MVKISRIFRVEEKILNNYQFFKEISKKILNNYQVFKKIFSKNSSLNLESSYKECK